MSETKLFDSEFKVMDIIWEMEPVTAKEISIKAAEKFGWNKNTTYTVLTKLIDKKAVSRSAPNYTCISLIKKENVQIAETQTLINKLYNGSKKAFFAAFLKDETLTEEEIADLKAMIEKR